MENVIMRNHKLIYKIVEAQIDVLYSFKVEALKDKAIKLQVYLLKEVKPELYDYDALVEMSYKIEMKKKNMKILSSLGRFEESIKLKKQVLSFDINECLKEDD